MSTVEDAKKAVRDAQLAHADIINNPHATEFDRYDANQTVNDAKKQLGAALEDAKKARQKLTDAREAAFRELMRLTEELGLYEDVE